MVVDDNSTKTLFHTISQFNNSDIETPDEIKNSETSPSTFSQPPFRQLHTPTPDEPFSAPSSFTDATPILSPMIGDQPDTPSPIDEELENELDIFITLQQQLQNPNTLTIHHLLQSITSAESSNSASTIDETRAHRVFERKHPNTPVLPNPRPPRMFRFTHSTRSLKKFFKCAYHTFHNTFTTKPLTTINALTLTNRSCFPHFHGRHITIILTHYYFHYKITKKTIYYCKFVYIP